MIGILGRDEGSLPSFLHTIGGVREDHLWKGNTVAVGVDPKAHPCAALGAETHRVAGVEQSGRMRVQFAVACKPSYVLDELRIERREAQPVAAVAHVICEHKVGFERLLQHVLIRLGLVAPTEETRPNVLTVLPRWDRWHRTADPTTRFRRSRYGSRCSSIIAVAAYKLPAWTRRTCLQDVRQDVGHRTSGPRSAIVSESCSPRRRRLINEKLLK